MAFVRVSASNIVERLPGALDMEKLALDSINQQHGSHLIKCIIT